MTQPKSEAQAPHDLGEPHTSELETLCPYCNGMGGREAMYENAYDPCFNCLGAGYVPTPFGKRVLAFIRHQSQATADSA